MKWYKVDRSTRLQPNKGGYGDWKDQIAAECHYQCVYCALHECRFGGRRYAHIDHFRPKSLKNFENLRDVIHNLYYSCAVCNCFKSDDWPAEPSIDHSIEAFIDPSDHDFNDVFIISETTHEVSSTYRAGAYIIEKLFLNRTHLLAERRLSKLLVAMDARLDQLYEIVKQLFEADIPDRRQLLDEVLEAARVLSKTATILIKSIPYHSADQKRPKR